MSVKVNLLPAEASARQAVARQRTAVAGAGLVLVAALGGAYWWAGSQVSEAESRLAVVEGETLALQGEVAALDEIADLAARRDASLELLQGTLVAEVSFAGLLQDVAAVIPSDSQLEALNVDLTPPAGDAVVGTAPDTIGKLNITGKTLQAHAPGVERVLLELEKVASFRDLYVNSSALDDAEERVATFSVDAGVGTEALTGRYLLGLPEELR
jgi:Tfp pilus assembly protein PilN